MKENSLKANVLIKKCHCCALVMELTVEPQRCKGCGKSFLPANYFSKIHGTKNYNELYAESSELHPDELVRGLHVLW